MLASMCTHMYEHICTHTCGHTYTAHTDTHTQDKNTQIIAKMITRPCRVYHQQFSLVLGAWRLTDQRSMRISNARLDTSQVQEEAPRTKSGLFFIIYPDLSLPQPGIVYHKNCKLDPERSPQGEMVFLVGGAFHQLSTNQYALSTAFDPQGRTACLRTHYVTHWERSPGLSREYWEGGCSILSENGHGNQIKGHPWPSEVPSSLTGGLFTYRGLGKEFLAPRNTCPADVEELES